MNYREDEINMISTTIFPGRYVQGAGAINRLGKEAERFGRSGLIICDPYIYENQLSEFRGALEEELKVKVERFNGECCDEEIDRLLDLSRKASCDVIVGIGGGKTLDTAKAISYELNSPVVTCPTIAATDAPTSAVAVIYTSTGEFDRNIFLPKNPDMVLVDTNIITKAPIRFLVSGMGDALSTWFEAESCKIKYAPNTTGDHGSLTAYTLARLCYETLLEFGTLAKTACENNVVTPALEHIVEANVLLSGLGFESGGLGSAHSIHDGLTNLGSTHHYYHGEKVAIGTLASLFLTDKPKAVIDEVFTFCESVDLPTTLTELGLENITDEDLMKVAEIACDKEKFTGNEPIPVNPEAVFSALKVMDAEGRKRKS